MSFDRSDRDRVLEATDMVALVGEHVRLAPKGREHLGLCPFHDDHRPSMAVVTHKGIPFFKCFSCGAAGNAIDFVMRYHRVEFPEALRLLAERSGITLTPRRSESGADRDARTGLLKANEFASRTFRRFLADGSLGTSSREMIARRGVPAAAQEAFALGAAPAGWDHLSEVVSAWLARGRGAEDAAVRIEDFVDAGLLRRSSRGEWIDGFRHRLMFPIRSEMGRVVAFGARQIDPEDQPKYLNSPESAVFKKSATLFGLDLAKQSIIRRRLAVVVEGYLDVIACHAAGFDHVVATLGTALTAEHARLLRNKAEAVVLLFDGDEAGQRAADRAVEVFFGGTLDVRIGVLPGGLDPDDLLKKPEGREVLEATVAGAIDSLEFLLQRFRGTWRDATGLSGRQQALEAFLRRLADLGFARMNPLRRSLVLERLAAWTGVTTGALLGAMPAAVSRQVAAPSSMTAESPPPSVASPFDAAIEVPPSRRVAEHTLVSVLIAFPQHAADAPARPLLDPLANVARTWLLAALAAGREPVYSDLFAEVPAPRHRDLDELLALADRRPSLEGDAPTQLAAALDDLDRLDRLAEIDRERLDSASPSDPLEVARRLERLRHGGGRATAIGRIARPA